MSLKFWGAAALLSLGVGVAHALPSVSLTFAQPDGVVGPTDEIAVVLKLVVDPDSPESWVLDYGSPTLGMVDVPVSAVYNYQDEEGAWQGIEVLFISYEQAFISPWYGCAGTFTNGCSNGTPYTFSFGDGGANLTELLPGQEHLIDFGLFKAASGGVPAGTYVFGGAGLDFTVMGWGEDPFNPGEMVYLESRQFLAVTCSDWWAGEGSSCTGPQVFSRTVVAVPEPRTWALVAAGFLAVVPGWLARRRGHHAQAEFV